MRLLAVTACALLMLGAGVAPARASCAGPPEPAQLLATGDLAFVGTVGSLRNDDRWATFQVHEVWSTDELPRIVEVRGSHEEEALLGIFGSVSSSDRYFDGGVKYLVFPTAEGGILFDHNCSATQEWTDGLAALRPATAHPASPGPGDSTAGSIWPVALAGLALMAGVGVMFWTRRPRRSGGEPTPA